MNTRNRRRGVSFRTRLMILIAAAAVTIGITAFTSQKTKADPADLYKYYTSYEVKSGDTLWSIAKEYSGNGAYDTVTSYIDEVCSINHLPSDRIYAGNEICIPYYSTEYKK
jgi:hypothetical protein